MVFGKAFHFPIELERRALWALKRLNFKHDEALQARLTQFYLLDEYKLKAYEILTLYKVKMKRWDDLKILKREFAEGDLMMF